MTAAAPVAPPARRQQAQQSAAPIPAEPRFAVLKFTPYPANGSGVLTLVRVRIGDLVIDGFQLQGYIEDGYARHLLIPPPNVWMDAQTRNRLQEHILAAWREHTQKSIPERDQFDN